MYDCDYDINCVAFVEHSSYEVKIRTFAHAAKVLCWAALLPRSTPTYGVSHRLSL